MRARSILMAAVATAALAGCGDFLSLDAEASNACVTISGVHVPGANEIPVNHLLPQLPTVTARQTIDVPLDSTVLPQGSAYRVKLVSFRLEAQGTQSMAFVESAQLEALHGGARTVVATYQRTSTQPVPAIEAAPDPAPDVTPYIESNVLHLEGALTGTVPAQGFAADATICFDVATTLSAK